ncbi:MAG: MBOAT family protein [Verrucomicrobiae bacterium]|nr:MBOAT family protein [Verrucomicrobiae bacterium]
MLFNSITFVLFHFLCVGLYWLVPQQKVRQVVLMVGSAVFYGWYFWPALILLGASILVNYGFSRWIDAAENKSLATKVAILVNLSSLCWFKYSAFISENCVDLLAAIGIEISVPPHSHWLPLGISFYTFQVIGYLVDISRGKIGAEKSFLVFGVFKCFYAQLVAGPIVRASELIPQLTSKRVFRASDFLLGLYLLLVGLAFKISLADTLAQFVEHAFNNPGNLEVATAWLSLYAFSAQILCDFWGYSTVAIGLGLMYGIQLPINFNLPYLATSIREFWHRWHITLSEWLRDYLYIPLGGNRAHQNRNLFLTMLLGGLWHGASWNFVFWGTGHGIWLVLERLIPKFLPSGRVGSALRWFLVFNGVSLLWVFFRAETIGDALAYFKALLIPPFTMIDSPPDALVFLLLGFVLFSTLLGKSMIDRRFLKWSRWRQVGVAFLMILLILSAADARLDFIYFVF